MKIKVWALVLIIMGSMLVGAAGMFVGMSGVILAGRMIRNVQQVTPQANAKLPYNDNGSGSSGGGYYGGRTSPGKGYNSNGTDGSAPVAPALPAGLPDGFNAGVNIESTYAALTSRTAEQVQAAEQSAGTDVWGLASQEGKLDDLKAKVTDAVVASLNQMVADKKITQEQSDSYLNWVKQYLQTTGQGNFNGMMPGYRQRGGWQNTPNATPDPGSMS